MVNEAASMGLSQAEYEEALNLEKVYTLSRAARCCAVCGRGSLTSVDTIRFEFVCAACGAGKPGIKKIGIDLISSYEIKKLENKYGKVNTGKAKTQRRRNTSRRRQSPSDTSESSSDSDAFVAPSYKSHSNRRSNRKNKSHRNNDQGVNIWDKYNTNDNKYYMNNENNNFMASASWPASGDMPGMASMGIPLSSPINQVPNSQYQPNSAYQPNNLFQQNNSYPPNTLYQPNGMNQQNSLYQPSSMKPPNTMNLQNNVNMPNALYQPNSMYQPNSQPQQHSMNQQNALYNQNTLYQGNKMVPEHNMGQSNRYAYMDQSSQRRSPSTPCERDMFHSMQPNMGVQYPVYPNTNINNNVMWNNKQQNPFAVMQNRNMSYNNTMACCSGKNPFAAKISTEYAEFHSSTPNPMQRTSMITNPFKF